MTVSGARAVGRGREGREQGGGGGGGAGMEEHRRRGDRTRGGEQGEVGEGRGPASVTRISVTVSAEPMLLTPDCNTESNNNDNNSSSNSNNDNDNDSNDNNTESEDLDSCSP